MEQPAEFIRKLETFYAKGKRDMPWRQPDPDGTYDPYKIMVSEFMLQQTQVARVIPKYQAFLAAFPTIRTLAEADFSAVVAVWVGLGYNRRARFLWQSARRLTDTPEPWTYEDLVACPGIGPNTAAAIVAYSYDMPVVFVETNIRTVVIHHFFADKRDVTDKEILEVLALVARDAFALQSPREFYWAMMDYGTHLKATIGNLNKNSKSYVKQSRFTGSNRQIRGQVIRLLARGPMSLKDLAAEIPDTRLPDIIQVLQREKMINFYDDKLMLYNEA